MLLSQPPHPPYPLSAGVASTSARGVASAQEVAKSSPSKASTPVGVRHLGWSGSYQSSSGSPSSSAEVPTGGKKDKESEVGNQGLGLTWESF